MHIQSISPIVSVLHRIITSNFWIFLSSFYLTNLITLQKLFFIHIKYSNVFIRTLSSLCLQRLVRFEPLRQTRYH